MNESVREEGYRSLIGGRNANGIARGGVTSGVGGLCCWWGVVGVEGASEAVLMDEKSSFGAGASIGLLPDDWREWVGGVGGKTGAPILLDVCFKVRGLEVSELVREDIPVSINRSRCFVAGVEGWCSDSRGWGSILCFFNNVVPTL